MQCDVVGYCTMVSAGCSHLVTVLTVVLYTQYGRFGLRVELTQYALLAFCLVSVTVIGKQGPVGCGVFAVLCSCIVICAKFVTARPSSSVDALLHIFKCNA